jgi:hypothetical protein
MTQALYAHMNNKTINKKRKKDQNGLSYTSWIKATVRHNCFLWTVYVLGGIEKAFVI